MYNQPYVGRIALGTRKKLLKSGEIRLLVKPPLQHKAPKNNAVSHYQWGRADETALFKAFLHNCGRAGISSKQFKKTKQDKRMYATFSKKSKNT